MNHEKLHVIAVISNPKRYESRYRLYRQFRDYMEQHTHVVLHTVELAFGNRPFEITEQDHPRNIQLRSDHELWHKENMINIAVSRLPHDWKYMATIDADVQFANPHWVRETIQSLQHYDIVQMFSEAIDLSPHYTSVSKGFGFVFGKQSNFETTDTRYGKIGRTGLAWAYTRDGFEKIGSLIDFAIMGSGDWYMAHGLFGTVEPSLESHLGNNCPEYKQMLLDWQTNAVEQIKGNVGYVPGLLFHHWHGKKSDRGYANRNLHLTDTGYNPRRDLRKTSHGLHELTHKNPELRDRLRVYFGSRNEDSVDY